MHVVLISNFYFPAFQWGGPVQSMHAIGTNLTRYTKTKLSVLTTDALSPLNRLRVPISAFPEVLDRDYEVYYCRRRFGKYNSFHLQRMCRRLIPQADVVHVTGNYTSSVLGALTQSRLANKPIVWSPRGTFLAERNFGSNRFPKLKKAFGKIAGCLLDANSAIHCTSEEEEELVRHLYPTVRTCCISNGVDVPEIEDTASVRQEEKTQIRLLFLSRLDPKKGIDDLLDCLALLPDRYVLDICGDGKEAYVRELEEKTNRLELSERVCFKGHVDGDVKAKAYRDADIFVLCSHTENFGNVIAEALAHRLPVVVSKETPWQDVATHRCGAWVDRDPVSFSKAIQSLENENLAEMGQRGRDWMVADFSWKSKALEFHKLFTDLTSNSFSNGE